MQIENVMIDLDGTLNENVFINDYLVTLSEKKRLIKRVKPYRKAKAILKLLKAKYCIYIVTGRSNEFRGLTEKWLQKYDFSYDELCMMNSQWQYITEYYDFKLRMVKKLKPVLVIDDNLAIIDFVLSMQIECYQIVNEVSWNYSVFELILQRIDYYKLA